MSTERGIPESQSAYATLDAAGAIDATAATAHKAVLDSNPIYWNPKFDDSSLKGSSPAAYTDVMDYFSAGEIDFAAAAEQLYNAYQTVLAQ